jgi:hypothetical protein
MKEYVMHSKQGSAGKRFHQTQAREDLRSEPKQSDYLLGDRARVFATPKAAQEYERRAAMGDWSTRASVTDSPRLAAMVPAHKLISCKTSPLGLRRAPVKGLRVAEVPSDGIIMGGKRFCPADPNEGTTVLTKGKPRKAQSSGAGIRVYPINGVWRRALVNADGTRQFVADYGNMNDALAQVNPITDHSNVTNKAHIVVQSEKTWAGG